MSELIQQLPLPNLPAPPDSKQEPPCVRSRVTRTAYSHPAPNLVTRRAAHPTVMPSTPTGAGEELLTKRELAARLKKTPRCIEQWMRRHYLPYIKIGHTVRFRWSDIIEALERLTIR